ncbi:Multidrug resistance-associated protein 7 [Sarcoptes scabiei]|uniref:ABC-type xenobiotic transporter n=1 Tax=Sarcoptes scabiei TaxID=52283 RepID=A0A834R215_SARSC|nr:Multidrug resistance-associated protein 7 [Sarcoptes scabiei]
MANILEIICRTDQDSDDVNTSTINRALNEFNLFQSFEIYYIGQCFQESFIILPLFILFILIISYRLGYRSFLTNPINRFLTNHYRNLNQSILFISILLHFILLYQIHTILIAQINFLVKAFCLILYFILIENCPSRKDFLETRFHCFTLLLIVISVFNLSELLTFYCDHYLTLHSHLPIVIILILTNLIWLLHCVLFVSGLIFLNESNRSISVNQSSDNLIADENYRERFSLYNDEFYSLFSKLSFSWVSSLLQRGFESRIHSPNDLFDLPQSLSAFTLEPLAKLFLNKSIESRSLIKYLFKSVYREFSLLLILKLFADILALLFPIVLNKLFLYLENESKTDQKSRIGFLLAASLLICNILNIVAISMYNFQSSKMNLKIRTLLITMVYDKIWRVKSSTLIDQFGTGQILNLSNIDIERTTNITASLFQMISLPIQLIVSLYLLYLEVEFVFIFGVLFIIILIPINKLLCNKITLLSQKMMLYKDQRIRAMSELLKGIQNIKSHSWEKFFHTKVNRFRSKEIVYLRYRKYLDALCVYFWATTPVIISSLVFTAYVCFNGSDRLISSKVFTTLALLGMLIVPLNALPWVLNGLMEALVSLRRLNSFFILSEMILDDSVKLLKSENDVIYQMFDCSFRYHQENSNDHQAKALSLSGINLKILKQNFIGITGRVGDGKSSLIRCLLNELQISGGTFEMNKLCLECGVGYVPQESWIQNGTIRDNILFGKEFDNDFYYKVIDACELIEDLKSFPQNDLTEIGNNGSTLSGGQQARITLARALYQNFSVYLIDEPFAKLDRKVGHQIYSKCFRSFLRHKCVLLVTNHIEYLNETDSIIVLSDGQIRSIEYDESNLIDSLLKYDETTGRKDLVESFDAIIDQETNQVESDAEDRRQGIVKMEVYNAYIGSIGYALFSIIILSICLMQLSRSASDFWLSLWTAHRFPYSTLTYLYVFIAIGVANSFITLLRAFLFAYGGVRAAINIHDALLKSLLESSVLFYDLISFGIIINRFSSDTFNIDDALPFTLNIFLAQSSTLVISLVITFYGMPWIIVVLVLLSLPYFMIQHYYRSTSRELKRIAAVSLSPIYSQLDDSLQGLTIIRSYRKIERFTKDFLVKINIYNRVQYSINAIQQWLNLRLQIFGSIVTFFVAFYAVYLQYYGDNQINSSLIGLSLVYSLSLTTLLNGSVQSFAQTELDLISVERCRSLIEKLTEFKEKSVIGSHLSNISISSFWQIQGEIRFENVSMRYRDDLSYALHNVSFKIEPSEHVAIVGRTGSGKSSIFQCLLRLVNIESGSIWIDGIDLKTIDLDVLRSRIYIISQDAFIYSGTVRENLDPLDQFDDADLWTALFDCRINILVDSLGGLDATLAENGKNLSVGQKQLFCLARAVLNRPKIIGFDEITANIDNETCLILDELIENVFKESTILHIAHKVDSIRNHDRIFQMNEGTLVECDSIGKYLAETR